jgi:tetratricopeptide (TPR) repeat protein
MLVVPEEADVVLEYGHTAVGMAGMVATGLALLILLGLIWREWRCRQARLDGNRDLTRKDSRRWKLFDLTSQRPQGRQTVNAGVGSTKHPWPRDWLALCWPLLLLGMGLWFHVNSPERLYANAWVLMRANQYQDAAVAFDLAFAARKSDGKKEEALFWSAKAYEQAGKMDEALQRYRQLTANFHGYWLPESLYNQWRLAPKAGQQSEASAARVRLLSDFPNDRWAQLAGQQ